MTLKKNPLTRKLGPLPAYAWLLVIVGAYLAYSRFTGAAQASSVQLPVTGRNAISEPAGTGGGGGGGSGIPSLPSDLLNQLIGSQTQTIDALAGALTSTPAGQAASLSDGAAPSASAQEGPASSPSQAATTENSPYGSEAIASGGLTNQDLPTSQQVPGLPANAYVITSDMHQARTLNTGLEPQALPTISYLVGAPGPDVAHVIGAGRHVEA